MKLSQKKVVTMGGDPVFFFVVFLVRHTGRALG